MISDALRLLRVYNKTSQSQLAKALGISKSYLSEIESGRKKVTIDLLSRYSSYFHVPLSALFFFAEELDRSRTVDRAQGAIALGALRLLNKIASGATEVIEC